MHSIVIYLTLLLNLDYMISNSGTPIWINRNECIFEIKMHSLSSYFILLVKTRLFNF